MYTAEAMRCCFFFKGVCISISLGERECVGQRLREPIVSTL